MATNRPERPASATPPPAQVVAERLSPGEADALRRQSRVVPGAAADGPGVAPQLSGAASEALPTAGLFRGLSTLPLTALGFAQRHPLAAVVAIGIGTGLLQVLGGLLARLPEVDRDVAPQDIVDDVPERHGSPASRRRSGHRRRVARGARAKAS